MRIRTQAQRKRVSESIKQGLREAKAKGVQLGTPKPQTNLCHLNPLAIAQIKKNADDFARNLAPMVVVLLKRGWNLSDIAAHFNQKRIRTARNRRWYATTVVNVLKRFDISVKEFKTQRFLGSIVGRNMSPISIDEVDDASTWIMPSFAEDFYGRKESHAKREEQIKRVARALRAYEHAREKPPKSRL